MFLLHSIGPRLNSNYNTPEEVLNCPGPFGIDGIYESILIHADMLKGKEVILFVMGAYVGGDNSFDQGQPYARFLDWTEIKHLQKVLGAKLGWHTHSHRDLTMLSPDAVVREVMPPFPMDYFAYPYGKVNAQVAGIVEAVGYKEAFCAGEHGDGSQFQRKRSYLGW